MTNGDMVRAMTDEQLVAFINNSLDRGGCPPDALCVNAKGQCTVCWETWLKRSADE